MSTPNDPKVQGFQKKASARIPAPRPHPGKPQQKSRQGGNAVPPCQTLVEQSAYFVVDGPWPSTCKVPAAAKEPSASRMSKS